MKKIKSFGDWNLVNEAQFYYLSQFRKALDKAPKEFEGIVADLKELWGKETGIDMTMFDIEGDMLSYSTGKSMNSHYLDNSNVGFVPHERGILNGGRSKVKIGRVLNRTINNPKKYPESLIDRFVVYLQSWSKDSDWTIKLVKGDEIAKYYDSSNYSDENKWGTSLWQSCMTDKSGMLSKELFDIYTKNPEVCSLAIMVDSDGKLGARALVWNVSNCWVGDDSEGSGTNFQFMDRVYSINEWMVVKMRTWAEERGMALRRFNMGFNCEDIIYGGKEYHVVKMEVEVKKIYYSKFPYLDTFNKYDVKSGKLLNYTDNNFKGFGLQTTSGGRTTTGVVPTFRNYIRRFNQ
jgi:hypothetical protein